MAYNTSALFSFGTDTSPQPVKIEWCAPQQSPPVALLYSFDWVALSKSVPGFSVNPIDFSVNVDMGNQRGLISQVKAVTIDNRGGLFIIVVTAMDTGHAVTCDPNTTITVPIFTSNFNFRVSRISPASNDYFRNARGRGAPTSIIFLNTAIPASIGPAANQSQRLFGGTFVLTGSTSVGITETLIDFPARVTNLSIYSTFRAVTSPNVYDYVVQDIFLYSETSTQLGGTFTQAVQTYPNLQLQLDPLRICDFPNTDILCDKLRLHFRVINPKNYSINLQVAVTGTYLYA